ncbi:hypothetical protein BGZ96_001853 [Linnemannia gamsii]|uniref:NACHT domain-containing protein n=1 Tax=Linnemannia gamsii TaxID=64522 RepID=A0ABQ7JLT7_9FUNG|nr:hypothetical protein BGZ96_001853 [Linnemannia gamsii]
MQRLAEYKQPVYVAPLGKPSLQAQDDKLFPLMKKSTFNRHLETELWRDYESGDRIPLFVNVPTLERPEKELLAEQLRTYRFSEMQIQELVQYHQFVLICDGYDESQLTCNLHTTNFLNQFGQRHAKLIITCRSQYLGPDYRLRFVPEVVGEYHRTADDLFMQAVIAPFSTEQIEEFALPNVIQGKADLSRLRVTRVQLYDVFVQHWLGVNKRRLQKHKLSGDKLLAFDWLLEEGFESNGVKFQEDLAVLIFREQEGRPVVDYTQRRDGVSWKAAFFGPEPDITLLRDTCLLSRVGTQYRFVHRSILEYFYSCSIYGPTLNNEEFAPHPRSNSSNIGDHPLSKVSLVLEPSIIQFLAERVHMNPDFKKQLLDFIEQSKTDVCAICAAANAITILVKAGVSFNGSDLGAFEFQAPISLAASSTRRNYRRPT